MELAMNQKLKEMELAMNKKVKDIELVTQDKLLRQSRELEDLQKNFDHQAEESSIAISSLEEENASLRSNIPRLKALMVKVVGDEKEKLVLLENKYELQCKALKEESKQHQEDLKNVEVSFYELVKKYTRLQEVTESLRRNEESLKVKNVAWETKFTKKEEEFKNILQLLEEKYRTAREEFQADKEKHEHELNKAFVMLKKAEVKILSLSETIEKKTTENQRLTALIDDITKKFG